MDRLKERIEVARKALGTLQQALTTARPTTIERDASIKRLEYSVETVWKAAQQYLRDREGLDIASPKAAIRACRETGLLTDQQAGEAIAAVDDRTLTAHTYNEELARALLAPLPAHAALLTSWLENMAALSHSA